MTRALKDIIKLGNRDKLLFAVIFGGLLLWLLFAPPISHRGEAREGLVVQGILHHQQWILPYRNGQLPSKPPLFHWIAAAAAMIFGESDFAMRLPSAIGAGLMIVVTFLLGRAIAGKRMGWLAVGALLGIYDFWTAAGQARVDMVFSGCVTAAIAGFYFWYRDRPSGARAVCYIATVFAVLAKGPLGIVLIGLVIVGFLAVENRLRLVREFWSWPFAAAAIIVICGWYGLAYSIGGERFLALQVSYENVDRFIGGAAFPRRKMYIDMLSWLATQTFPWNLVLFWSAIRWLRGAREDSTGRILHIWWLAIFVVFALASRTRPVYFLPMFPAIALLAARALNAVIFWSTAGAATGSLPHTPTRSRQVPMWIGAAIVLCDLTLLVVDYRAWHNDKHGEARIAFHSLLSTAIPANTPLFVTPEVQADDVMVLAYRLRQPIERRALSCATRNDYYLTTINQMTIENAQELASVKNANLALVTRISPTVAPERKDCQMHSIPVTDNDDN